MNKRRILLGLLLVVVVALIIFLILRRRDGKPDTGRIRVAAILSLNGPAARFDAVKQQTVDLALSRVKALYPDTPIELRVLDAGEGPETTNAAIKQALDWGASYFLSGTSPTALAIAAEVRGRTPAVVQMANAANPDFGPPRIGEYRFWPDWKQEADLIQGVIQSEKIGSVFLIHSADPYSEALNKELKEKTKALNNFTLRDLQYDPASTPDFRPALLRAKQEGTQAIVIFGLPPGIQALMSQMAETHWDQALIGGVNINLAVSDYDAAHLTGPLWLIETEAMRDELPAGSEAQSFRSAYQQKYSAIPAFHSLYLADALYFIAAAAAKFPDPNLPEVERIKTIRDFNSASGHIEVNEDGTLRFVMSARRVR